MVATLISSAVLILVIALGIKLANSRFLGGGRSA